MYKELGLISSEATDPRWQLIAAAHHFYQQGWMVGTSGNLSCQLSDGSLWITASGRSKGALTVDDFIHLDATGRILNPETRWQPSAETAIHQIIYSLFPEARACYHIHSVEANLVTHLVTGDTLPLPPLEMLKGLGIRDEHPQCVVPVFPNYQQVSKIAAEIGDRFRHTPPQVPALLIRNHGLTIWAASLEAAHNSVELMDYIFRYQIMAHQFLHS